MSDFISREEAAKRLEALAEQRKGSFSGEAFAFAAKIVRGVPSATDNNVGHKWIPVTERLPEDDLPKDTKRQMIRCLVYTDKGTVKPCVRHRWVHFDGKIQPWMWNKDLYAKPTHWMPLPEPPKGE